MQKLFFIALLLFPFLAISQDFTFGQLSQEDVIFDKKKIDSNANAVYLNEFGNTRFLFDSETGHMKLLYEYHVRIKIFNKQGFDAANIVVPLYKSGTANDQREYISNIKAVTLNYQDGRTEETTMSDKAIFTEEKSKYITLTKFTLPNIKENSIIEYQYSIETPYLFNFRTWHFQTEYPKLNSTYVAYIPANYRYNVTLRGFYPLTDEKADLSTGCLRVAGKDMDCSKLTYHMKDIPAFIEEDYMTAPSNYKSAIYFELSEVYYLNGSVQKYTKSWTNIDYELASNKEFGGQMKKKDVFKALVPEITKGTTDQLQKAKLIFDYIKKQIRWNNYYGKYSETSVKEVIDRRTGNVADINFALISALAAADIDVEAVMLSTRDNGTVNKLYPILSDFNYVVAKANIGNDSYLLDATEPLTPFGLLPLRCVNDQGRVINLKKPSYWIDLKAGKKSSTIYSLSGKLNSDGKIVGLFTFRSQGFHALNTRKEMKKYNSIEEYVEKLDDRLSNIKIKNFKVSNLDSVENMLVEEYEVEINTGNANQKDSYFNPFFINRISKNPFKLKERNYPVDLGAASEERVAIQITLPEHLRLKEQPANVSLGLPNQGGKYLLETKLYDNNLIISQQLQFNKAIYTAEEYHYLKEFYNRVIQAQKSDIRLAEAN